MLVERGWLYSTLMYNIPVVRTGTLLTGILKTNSLRRAMLSISPQFENVSIEALTDDFWNLTKGSPEDPLGAKVPLGASSTGLGRNIFVSYRRDDSEHVTGRICDRLVHEFGDERVFKDVDSIPAGVKDFGVEIEQRLRSTRVMLAVVGARWLTIQDADGRRRLDDEDDLVRIELGSGLGSETTQVIPVLVDKATMPAAMDLPVELKKFAKCHAVSVRGDPEFGRDVRSLIADIKHWLEPGA